MSLKTALLGGQVVESSEEELGRLSQAKGLQVRPTSSLAATMIGANPDQAKMAATEQNKGAALQEASQPATPPQPKRQTLEQYKEQQANQATPPDQAAANKAAALERVGSLGSRVQNLIEERLKAASQAGPATSQVANQVDTKKQGAIQTYLDAQKSGKGTTEAIQGLIQAGVIDAGDLNTAGAVEAKLEPYLKTASESLNVDTSNATFTPEELGLTAEDMASLGMQPGQALSVEQIQRLTSEVKSADLSRVKALQAKLNDPFTSQAEREQILSELRTLSAANVTGTEQAAEEAQMGIDEAGGVTLFGQAFNSLEEALESGTIQDKISEYLSTPLADRAKFAADNKLSPELTQWMDSSEAELKEEMEARGKTVEAVGKAEASREFVNKSLGDLASKIFGGGVNQFGQAVDWQKDYPGMALFEDMSAGGAAEFMKTDLDYLVNKGGPEGLSLAKELLALSPDELKQVMASAEGFDPKSFLADRAQLSKLDPTSIDLANGKPHMTKFTEVLDQLFGSDIDGKTLLMRWNQSSAAERRANPALKALNQFDTNKDGKIDQNDQLSDRLKYIKDAGTSLKWVIQKGKGATPIDRFQVPEMKDSLKSALETKPASVAKKEKANHDKVLKDVRAKLFSKQGVKLDKILPIVKKLENHTFTANDLALFQAQLAKLRGAVKSGTLEKYGKKYGMTPEEVKAMQKWYTKSIAYWQGLASRKPKSKSSNKAGPVTSGSAAF